MWRRAPRVSPSIVPCAGDGETDGRRVVVPGSGTEHGGLL